MKTFNYQRDYPKNTRWRAFSRQQLKLRPICEECLVRPSQELHHRTYYDQNGSLLGREQPWHVTSICRVCHEEIEGFKMRMKHQTVVDGVVWSVLKTVTNWFDRRGK